ncbi:MAG TPA: hypothetical protein PLU17_01120 [Chitinophagaceae bacterium]|nr:hypothetical protein [Chitinophagaceae bacterium]
MKQTYFTLLLLVATLVGYSQNKFIIKPLGYSETNSTIVQGSNQLSSINTVGGHFRLKEFSSSAQKMIETDLITYFIGKNEENKIRFSVNCAKQINLYYIISDASNKHDLKVREETPYYRFAKDLDISSFRNGKITISVYNENKDLIHVIEFEKASI